ncbi:MAG: glucose-6-phosphate dehydrogenase assembly protein OpcA [Candidatus Tumulicola sp.]
MSLDLQSILGELTLRRRNRGDVMDVALMTLVAFFEDAAVAEWLRDRIHSLAVKDPARVIVLDGTATHELHHVGAACDEHDDCLKTRGEWIELGVQGSDPDTLQSAISALALPQTPIVLVWASGRIGTDARFAGISPNVRTVVYNSSALDDGQGGLRELIAFVQEHPGVSICDLAYLRLAPWQESIALFFDGKNVIRELFDLRRVEISSGSEAEAYYLLGWLASRLEWSAHCADRFHNRFGTEIEFTISREGSPRRIRRVALHSSQTQFIAELGREKTEVIALTVTGAAQHPDRCHPITNIDTAALIERAILTGHDDRIFHDTLLAARDILAQTEKVHR